MPKHSVVSRDAFIAARRKFLAKEKKFTRLRDQLTAERQRLPWMRVGKDYVFDGPDGKQSLADLFDGRGQLIVYHFMFGPDWQAGCPHCSRWADNFNGVIAHLNQRGVTMIVVSRAPYRRIAAYRKRMGWRFKWVSSHDSDFNFDFGVSFAPDQLGEKVYNFCTLAPGASEREGVSVFVKGARGRVFHTYSGFASGIEDVNLDYRFLDLVPKGRDEGGRGPYWVRRRDEY